MDVGIILIASILVLGGAIATAGDRIGTRVGKARLSLFNLRPRQTAVLVTILTGITVSGSTLGILFATSESLRVGLFQLDKIQKNLRNARKDLAATEQQKQQIESQLTQARSEIAAAQNRLDATNESLKNTRAKQLSTEKQLQEIQSQLKKVSQQGVELRAEIQTILTERQQLIQQRDRVKAEITELKAKVAQRDRELAKQDRAISDRDQKIANQDRKINERDQVIAQRETLLQTLGKQLEDSEKQLAVRVKQLQDQEKQLANQEKQLANQEKQLAFLQQELATLEQYYQYYQVLREGNVALLRGQVLASGVLRIVEPKAARQAIDQLLTKANKAAIEATRSTNKDVNERVVQISQAQVEQLLNQIKDGRPYVIRIFSAGNYVVGEKQVEVFADAVVNQVVFTAGDVLAATSTDSSTMGEDEIRKRLEQLLVASQFRAGRAGIMADKIQIGDNRIITLIRFIEEIKQFKQPVDLQAIVAENIYTAGPLKIKLVAIKDGQVVFST